MNSSQLSVNCPALFIAAPASGQGKTTVTSALARYLKQQNKTVTIFKTGPDYLDPQILAQASGHAVEPLDLWMAGESYCRDQLYKAACHSDVILIEGAMGIFDGQPSSADLAATFNIPIALVMDVKGMAQTVGAVADGIIRYRDDVQFAGLIANKCGSARHAELIQETLPNTLPLMATLAREEAIALPERHLGLVQASEVASELEQRFDQGAAELLAGGIQFYLETTGIPMASFRQMNTENAVEQKSLGRHAKDLNAGLSKTENGKESAHRPLDGVRIGIAKDEAFSFIYAANINALAALGAECLYFSPMHDSDLPECDAVWLPGGYPELHAEALSTNHSMLEAFKVFQSKNNPILAECGGFLYCLESLTDLEENTYTMSGMLHGHGMMRGKRGCQGMQTAILPEGEIRGHAHHRSRSEKTPSPIAFCRRQRHAAPGEPIYRKDRLTATYLHLFFPSNLDAVVKLFKKNSDEPIKP